MYVIYKIKRRKEYNVLIEIIFIVKKKIITINKIIL